jgi:hypothetical protein
VRQLTSGAEAHNRVCQFLQLNAKLLCPAQASTHLTLYKVAANIPATRKANRNIESRPMNQNSVEEGVLIVLAILCVVGIVKLVSVLLWGLFSEALKVIH